MSIFDLMTSQDLAAYWEELTQDRQPYVCEELFPPDKKRGLDLKWIKGAKGLPVVLKVSAYDSKSVPRGRIGFDKMSSQMPFFKESKYIDEELRQELNMVLETGNQAYIDSVMSRIFDDEIDLLEGAAAARERMRMLALTTGVVAMASNGQDFAFDYEVPSTHKGNVAVSWETVATADPIEDIRKAKQKIMDDTGAEVTRAMCDEKTWRNLRNNAKILKAIFVLTNGVGAISDKKLREYLIDELDIRVVVNSKRYVNEEGKTMKYMPENTFVLFPEGNLGKTWFGTTPEESDLMSSNVANVSIVDTGVAITTIESTDPVNVETKVTQICLPSFEMADQVYILSTVQG